MKQVKNYGLMFIGILAICTICVFAVSCQEETETPPSLNENQTAATFISSLDDNVDSFINTDIVITESTLTPSSTRSQCVTATRKLYVDLSVIDFSLCYWG